MFVKKYSWLLAIKLLSLVVGGGLLFWSWQQTHLAGVPTSSVVLLIDGSASFVSSPDNSEQSSSRLFQQTINHIVESYPHSPLGVIVASDQPTYLLPDTQQRTSLGTAIPLLFSLEQTTEIDWTTTARYLEEHVATGSHIYLLTDATLAPPPPGNEFTQHLRTKHLTVDILQLLPQNSSLTPQLQQRGNKQYIRSTSSLSTPTDIQQITSILPGSANRATSGKALLIAILLLLLGL